MLWHKLMPLLHSLIGEPELSNVLIIPLTENDIAVCTRVNLSVSI